MNFNAMEFLEEYGIDHRPANKDWTQVKQCPFCLNNAYHLGINTKKTFFNCFVCHKSGRVEFLIYNLLKIPYAKAKEIAELYGASPSFESEPGPRAEQVKIAGMTTLRPLHIEYLKSRGYDYLFLERRYQIGACYTVGRFPYRIVIPIYSDGVLVNATSRDVTGQQKERYLSLSNEEAVIPRNECVYNIDSVAGENLLIVEGPFDVWRIGGSTVSTFGTGFTMAQVVRILSKFPKNIYIMFDNETEAQKNANRLASCFAPLVPHVEILGIPVKDPAMLSEQEAIEIRNELKL
jgi:DNA primase